MLTTAMLATVKSRRKFSSQNPHVFIDETYLFGRQNQIL
jgi:hypothetical protein